MKKVWDNKDMQNKLLLLSIIGLIFLAATIGFWIAPYYSFIPTDAIRVFPF